MAAEDREGAVLTCDGRLLHKRAAATGNALMPTLDRRVCRTSRNVVEAERVALNDDDTTIYKAP